MTPFDCVRSRRSGSVRREIGVVENFTALFLFFENEEKFQKVGQTTTVVLIALQVKPLKVRFDIFCIQQGRVGFNSITQGIFRTNFYD